MQTQSFPKPRGNSTSSNSEKLFGNSGLLQRLIIFDHPGTSHRPSWEFPRALAEHPSQGRASKDFSEGYPPGGRPPAPLRELSRRMRRKRAGRIAILLKDD